MKAGTAITHEAISERFAELALEEQSLADRQMVEFKSLVELCGGLGHRFLVRKDVFVMRFDPKSTRKGDKNCCEVCGYEEWVDEPKRDPLDHNVYYRP